MAAILAFCVCVTLFLLDRGCEMCCTFFTRSCHSVTFLYVVFLIFFLTTCSVASICSTCVVKCCCCPTPSPPSNYQMYNEEITIFFPFLFPLSVIVPLRPCQPIVFVSDRARANKEIEHDGIRGEKRKPKVTVDTETPKTTLVKHQSLGV